MRRAATFRLAHALHYTQGSFFAPGCNRCNISMPKAPQPKTLEAQPIALAWQPESRRHFAVGCVDGRVEIHSTKQAQPLARSRLPPEQWPQRSCKCWLGRTLGKSSGRAG